jgi:hypothetical protein
MVYELCKNFPIHFPNGLKEDALLFLPFNSAFEHRISKVQVNQEGLKLNGTHQLLMLIHLAQTYGYIQQRKTQKLY